MKIELNRDWTEFLSALIARRVKFVIVGRHAVAGHGEPRLTEDLDVFVAPDLGNAEQLRGGRSNTGSSRRGLDVIACSQRHDPLEVRNGGSTGAGALIARALEGPAARPARIAKR